VDALSKEKGAGLFKMDFATHVAFPTQTQEKRNTKDLKKDMHDESTTPCRTYEATM
jgi:hypothetical protein